MAFIYSTTEEKKEEIALTFNNEEKKYPLI